MQPDRGSSGSASLLDLLPRLAQSTGILPGLLVFNSRSSSRAASSGSRSASSTGGVAEITAQEENARLTQAEASSSSEADTSSADGNASTSTRADADVDAASEEEIAASTAAARHRLTAASNIDLQALATWVEKTAPYFGLLCIVFVYQHYTGLAIFAFLSVIVHRANEVVKRQVASKSEFQKSLCIAVAVGLAVHVPFVIFLLQSERLWLRFALATPSPAPGFWLALFWVTTVDLLARHLGMSAKLAVVVGWRSSSAEGFRRRAQCLTYVENMTLLYRAILPVPVWYKFFEDSGMGMVLCAMATGIYLLLKCGRLVEQSALVASSARAVLLREAAYGHYAKPEEVMEAGNQCAICQDPMADPIKLHCNHIFCDKCISEWFERERTCPMCRAVIKTAELHAFGDGSTMQLPQCF